MGTLLGQFYTKIKGSQEDIASEGLVYILQRSKNARSTINKIVKNECGIELPDLDFISQNIGEKLERPDISGFDDNRKERLIFEAKFWASLTENQPVNYLNRLVENSVLIFVCPSLRVRPIYSDVLNRIKSETDTFQQFDDIHAIILSGNKHILIKTWDEILGIIRIQLAQENNQPLLSDIDQIIGFCEIIDKNAFLPIQSEELSPSIPKRINSYYDVIDKVVSEIKKTGKFNTKGLKVTPQTWGYRRYARVYNFGISIDLNFEYWEKVADTPFWIGIKLENDTSGWSVSEQLLKSCKRIISSNNLFFKNSAPYIPLFPAINTTEDIVIHNISKSIVDLVESIYLDIQNNQ